MLYEHGYLLPQTCRMLAIGTAAAISMSASDATIFVDASVTSSGTGASWGQAKKTLQEALAIASGQTDDQIWVAAGTYKPNEGLPSQPSNPRDATFSIPSGITLLGGFAGGESSPDEAVPSANLTILSGDRGQIDHVLDNNFHVIFLDEETDSVLIDGFIIERGYAPNGTLYPAGAGLLALGSTAPHQLRRCVFRNNTAGEGGASFLISPATAVIRDCRFESNKSLTTGGAISSSSIVIVNSEFASNEAQSGGAIYQTGFFVKIVNCTFRSNSAGLALAPQQGLAGLCY